MTSTACGRRHSSILGSEASLHFPSPKFAPFVSNDLDGACAHYVMVSKFQCKPFWLATQRDPQNDWTATQNRVNYDVFAQAPLWPLPKKLHYSFLHSQMVIVVGLKLSDHFPLPKIIAVFVTPLSNGATSDRRTEAK